MQMAQDRLTEKQLVDDFERINEQVQEALRDLEVDQPLPPAHGSDDEGLVVEPIYAYSIHASS